MSTSNLFNDSLYKGQTAVVTGAGQGIGFEICRQLSLSGCRVILNDIDRQLAENAAEKINAEGGHCEAYAGDAAEISFIRKMVEYAVEQFGALNIAVANAGITYFGNFFEYEEQHLESVLNLNLKGSFFLAQTAAKEMQKQGHGGRILFMSSVTGHQAHKNLAAYGMTKAALEMLAKALIIDLSPYKITINTIAPGATLTERTQSDDPDYEKIWSRITPMGRPATPTDIAATALFLLSPQASHITGQSIVVDGGWAAMSPSPDPE